jgi:hypothetical protein
MRRSWSIVPTLAVGAIGRVAVDAELVWMMPHMHTRGKDTVGLA